MASGNLAIILFFALVSFMELCHQACSSGNGGFRIRMLRSHPPSSSPSNDQGGAHTSEYWNSVHRRSMLRHNSLQLALTPAASTQRVLQGDGAFAAGGEYVMELNIGTPPQAVRAVVDSAGSFIWAQCFPCEHCSKPPPSLAVYSSSASSTFSAVLCDSTECCNVDQHGCGSKGECSYVRSYGDGRLRSGVIAHDTFAFPAVAGGNTSFDEISFECGTDDAFVTADASARVGLAGGIFSLVSQLGQQENWRFSYCLSPAWSSGGSEDSHLYVGDEAVLVGGSTALTQIQAGPCQVFYSPVLEDISVGCERVGIPATTFLRHSNGTGGVFLDTATPLTYLARVAFEMVVRKVGEQAKLGLAPAPAGGRWRACYNGTVRDLKELRMPYLTLHFAGLDVALHPLNMFAPVDAATVCLLAVPTDGVSIIGTYAQMNVNVGYDLTNNVLTMAPTVCTA